MSELSFGEWLKRQRGALGLTQKQLANQVGCSEITLRKLEAEERRPSEQIVERLALIFNIPKNEQKNLMRFARGNWESALSVVENPYPWKKVEKIIPSNLPAPINSFIGREKEIVDIHGYLQRDDIRLVTLIGPPGIGKTRLSLEISRISLADFPDGVFLVSLAPLDNPQLIPTTIFQALDYVESKEFPPLKQLMNGIGSKRILLVLDNCEHLIEDIAPLTSELLSACSRLKIITTSRESLRVPGEWLYSVSTLDVPKNIDIAHAENCPAVMLFAERARAVRADFVLNADNIKAVAAICAQLDGLPLAIELIASRIRLMSAQVLLENLNTSFVLSADGMRTVTARQKTLNNAISWTYNHLPQDEKKLFNFVSIFSGGFSLQTVEEVFSNTFKEKSIRDLVMSLSDKSMLQRRFDDNGEVRFSMLVTIQQFALEQLLQIGEEKNVREQHLQYFVEFSERVGRGLIGPQQMEWRARVLQEWDNLRAALNWAARDNVEEGMILASNLGSKFWENFNFQEGIHWLTKFLQRPDSHAHPKARVRALCVMGYLQFHIQRFDLMRSTAEEALTLSRAIGDKQSECDGLMLMGSAMQFIDGMEQKANFQTQCLELATSIGDVWRQAEALSALSWDKRDLKKAFACREQSIVFYRQSGDWQGLANALSVFASDVALSGDIAYAETLLNEYGKLNQHAGDKRNTEFVLTTKARIALLRGEYEQARSHLETAMAVLQELGNRMGYLWARARLGYVVLCEGHAESAKEIFFECIREFQKDGNRPGLIFPIELISIYFAQAGEYERAARLIGWAEMTHESIGDPILQVTQLDWAKTLNTIRDVLGEEAFKAMKIEGSAMTMDEVVAYTLKEDF
ncbi:MAG: helix-turn-helix domain-containing protein [Anaerolineales bacterium]|nr:helix-turn-helix domain-containing protein [Anaerolineales bacterium]MCB9109853.1 helix-turn-helix domain-containing protein [Anaerolineales bacterium]